MFLGKRKKKERNQEREKNRSTTKNHLMLNEYKLVKFMPSNPKNTKAASFQPYCYCQAPTVSGINTPTGFSFTMHFLFPYVWLNLRLCEWTWGWQTKIIQGKGNRTREFSKTEAVGLSTNFDSILRASPTALYEFDNVVKIKQSWTAVFIMKTSPLHSLTLPWCVLFAHLFFVVDQNLLITKLNVSKL